MLVHLSPVNIECDPASQGVGGIEECGERGKVCCGRGKMCCGRGKVCCGRGKVCGERGGGVWEGVWCVGESGSVWWEGCGRVVEGWEG